MISIYSNLYLPTFLVRLYRGDKEVVVNMCKKSNIDYEREVRKQERKVKDGVRRCSSTVQ